MFLFYYFKGGLNGNGSWSHLLLLGRRLSKTTRWFSNSKNSIFSVSVKYLSVLGVKYLLDISCLIFRRKLFDEAPEDNNYTPLPEDRPGGFNWGEEQAQNNNAAGNDE